MGFLKVIFIIAITMALSIALTMKGISQEEATKAPFVQPLTHDENKIVLPSKRLSRFLAQTHPRPADHCHKDNEICYLLGFKNSTCCNNKCMDLGYDHHNCGACKKKCKFTETCCRGQCVDTNFDKRHCGRCNNKCEDGQYCVYGLCDYA